MRLLIFVVAFNAEQHIIQTLDRIPKDWLQSQEYKILIINDASEDQSKAKIESYLKNHPELNITSIHNEVNLGYGGNQKKGYAYAMEHQHELVVLLHGDGQYAPEYLPQMIQPIEDNKAEVVLGSRMIYRMKALKGKMPLYKWVGNQILTTIQNFILGTKLSEFHTGYRAYKLESLKCIPIDQNSNYYDFDTEILIQLVDTKSRIAEISIPTFYGDEVSYVNGLKYAWLIIKATIVSRLTKRNWIKDSRFSY